MASHKSDARVPAQEQTVPQGNGNLPPFMKYLREGDKGIPTYAAGTPTLSITFGVLHGETISHCYLRWQDLSSDNPTQQVVKTDYRREVGTGNDTLPASDEDALRETVLPAAKALMDAVSALSGRGILCNVTLGYDGVKTTYPNPAPKNNGRAKMSFSLR